MISTYNSILSSEILELSGESRRRIKLRALRCEQCVRYCNSVGNKDTRRISIRQRMLHPSMLGVLDLASNSSSSPGRNGALTPYNDMKSLYFDDSLYENEMHYHIAQILDNLDDDPEAEELRIVCDSCEEYNQVLDALYRAGKDKFKFYGISSAPMDIIVEEDPRNKYRQFDEDNLLMKENDK